MLALRGCRLGITYPEITEMQAHAIFEAAAAVKKSGEDPHLEIMIPLTTGPEEFKAQAAIIHASPTMSSSRKASRWTTRWER